MNTTDKDRIEELEHIVRTMYKEMIYIQSINEKYETLLSDAQQVLLDSRNEYAISNKILKKTQKENEELRCHISNLTNELISLITSIINCESEELAKIGCKNSIFFVNNIKNVFFELYFTI